MSPNLDKQLVEKYPKIFSQKIFFECGDGWFGLIDKLCHYLQFNIDHNSHVKGVEGSTRYPQVVATQVKEKFGTLCFYARNASYEQDGLIGFVEYLSGSVCEVCGAPGKSNSEGWIKVRCDEHTEK